MSTPNSIGSEGSKRSNVIGLGSLDAKAELLRKAARTRSNLERMPIDAEQEPDFGALRFGPDTARTDK